MKICSKCRAQKELNDFGIDKRKPDGRKYLCKICNNAQNNKARQANPESYRAVNRAYARSARGRAIQRSNSLRRKFWPTLTAEQATAEYNRILQAQNNSCGLCGLHQSLFRMALAVDHNGKTGKVRGLLCNKCNRFEVGRHTLATAKMLLAYFELHEG
jgi:hypothetical protein